MKKRSLIFVLTLLLLMSSPLVHEEDPWQSDGIIVEPLHISESEEAIDDERAPSLRRSSRLAGKGNAPSIDDWPLPKLLEFLFSNDVTAPVGASHRELFALFLNCAGFPPVDQRPVSAPRKAPVKRKHCSQNAVVAPTPAAAPPAKRARASASAVASTAPANDAVLAALSSIQASLSSLNSRIQTLETTATPSSSSAFQTAVFTSREPAASSSTQASDVTPAPLDGISIPRRTLGNAVPISTGVPFYPPAAAISCNLRSQILAGNDVNLVKILLCSDFTDKRVVDCGDVSVMLKDSDPRLSKTLTLAEFIVAFGVFRDVICEVFPSRRAELDTYLAIIADLAMTYGGTLFYEYHKSFSAKAAMFIQRFNQRLDWSVVDLALISRHCTGRQALSCSICGSFSHSLNMCPKSVAIVHPPAGPKTDEDKVTPFWTPMCHNFNENVCKFVNCKYIHACSYCGDSHPKSVCPRRTRLVRKEKRK